METAADQPVANPGAADELNRRAVVAVLVEYARVTRQRVASRAASVQATQAAKAAGGRISDCVQALRLFGITDPDFPALIAEYGLDQP